MLLEDSGFELGHMMVLRGGTLFELGCRGGLVRNADQCGLEPILI